jgi:hypothetical protein
MLARACTAKWHVKAQAHDASSAIAPEGGMRPPFVLIRQKVNRPVSHFATNHTPKATSMSAQEALSQLQEPTDLYILSISHPILNPSAPSKRSSSASDQERTPSALQADLEHYRELFSKLRFSYVEQVTKERFLRAVTAEQPEFVDGDENRELGEKLAADKAALKARKEEVRGIIGDLEEQGRVLARRELPCVFILVRWDGMY